MAAIGRATTRTAIRFPAPRVTAAGALYIAATYDLCPSVTMTALIGQTRQAVDWLHRQAGEIGLDPARLVVAGHSAGGHIAASLAHTDWAAHGLPARALAGALPLSGLYDLEPIRLCYLNEACRWTKPRPQGSARPGI